ncbi:hypothetical protein [Vibrio sp. K4]|uniref:hypothetical protein n=1 Tax=Vibrio sp. K4 TaxID=3391579 RepID=UPI003DA6D3F9
MLKEETKNKMEETREMSLEQVEIDEFSVAVFEARESVQKSAQRIVKSKLRSFIGDKSTEYVQMSEDFLSFATIRLLEGIRAEKTEKVITPEQRHARQMKLWHRYKTDKDYLKKYLLTAVTSACHTRMRRWSLDTEEILSNEDDVNDGEFPSEARTREIDKSPAIRARDSRANGDRQSDEEWLVSNSSMLRVDGEFSGVDTNDLIDFFEQKKVSRDELRLILSKLSGESIEHLASLSNEKSATVQKRYQRALEKLGLTAKDLRNF